MLLSAFPRSCFFFCWRQDEPYAWEAREFLRRKLVGQEVTVVLDPANNNNNLHLGYVLLGNLFSWYRYIEEKITIFNAGNENISETLVSEGLATVRARLPDDRKKLKELEEKAKLAQKNIWDESSKPLVCISKGILFNQVIFNFLLACSGLERIASWYAGFC